MKIRSGFVSNSSSSSFLIRDHDVKTIGECAYYMLSKIREDWIEAGWKEDRIELIDFEVEYLDLSNFTKTTVRDFVPLWDRKK